MHQKNTLYIIDLNKPESDLMQYFHQFDWVVHHQSEVGDINKTQLAPGALLIHWQFIASYPSLLHDIYLHCNLPIVVVADEYQDANCIMALESGADDYIVKPLKPRELHARVAAINRRVKLHNNKESNSKEVIYFDNWKLYPGSRQLINIRGKELILSSGEYDLLLSFVRHPQKILDRALLLQVTKSADFNPFDRRIDVQISRLRQKIEADSKHPSLIKTIRNGGYMFTASVTHHKED